MGFAIFSFGSDIPFPHTIMENALPRHGPQIAAAASFGI
jgi:hypothetical protein